MSKLSALIGGLLVLTAARLCAGEQPDTAPFEVGQTVEIALAKPYRTAEGVRIEWPRVPQVGRETLTLRADGHEETRLPFGKLGRVEGLLAAVDDEWIMLDPGEKQPLLRVPRAAILSWETRTLPARDNETLPIGRQIRFVSAELGPRRLTGRLLAADEHTLLVQVHSRAEPIRLQRSSMERLDVRREERVGARDGAVIGGLTGGAGGAFLSWVFGALTCGDPCDHPDYYHRNAPTIGLAAGAAVGAAIGAVVGNFSTVERWARVPLSVEVAPQRGGARAALTLRF